MSGEIGFIMTVSGVQKKRDMPVWLGDDLEKLNGRWSEKGVGYTYIASQRLKVGKYLLAQKQVSVISSTTNHSDSIYGPSDKDYEKRRSFAARHDGGNKRQRHAGGSRSRDLDPQTDPEDDEDLDPVGRGLSGGLSGGSSEDPLVL